MRAALPLAALCLAAAFAANAGDGKIDYDHQDQWQAAHDTAQSPIDIVTHDAAPARDDEPLALSFDHTHAPMEAIDNGHAVEVETHATQATIRGRHFTLAQFHFHAQSEHTLDGKHFPLEGHYVFKAQDGRLAVVGVMYEIGKPNAQAQAVLDSLAHKRNAPHEVDIDGLLPAKRGYYHYLGSLTTPPLTENVEWYVLPAPVTMSKQQVDAFVAHYRHNNRNVQPLNGRPLVRYGG
ncbi:carbonic anhydrase family protein [Lysobacter sp. MMG2]|uniref:carbonic anhydrase family protein n=1 Tax=Lysobacter sp. MMG2 TaxID=2801338 RepID=UPI001C23B5EB|nr:carbonic anhydrase family protein [Lysobacter sp. MMG2]MBU8976100.1 carbonic anhydrase family protein [Lysobacter sp. MMG2]